VVGFGVGTAVGAGVGTAVGTGVGAVVGFGVGTAVGTGVGAVVGFGVGTAVGTGVGTAVGAGVGAVVGFGVGTGVGTAVGTGVGTAVGTGVGTAVGTGVGIAVGTGVGAVVGAGVGTGVPGGVTWMVASVVFCVAGASLQETWNVVGSSSVCGTVEASSSSSMATPSLPRAISVSAIESTVIVVGPGLSRTIRGVLPVAVRTRSPVFFTACCGTVIGTTSSSGSESVTLTVAPAKVLPSTVVAPMRPTALDVEPLAVATAFRRNASVFTPAGHVAGIAASMFTLSGCALARYG
jgi:hypothetical protein